MMLTLEGVKAMAGGKLKYDSITVTICDNARMDFKLNGVVVASECFTDTKIGDTLVVTGALGEIPLDINCV